MSWVLSWFVLGLAGCTADSTKSSPDTPSIPGLAETKEKIGQPQPNDIQERAVPPRMAPGVTTPVPARTIQPAALPPPPPLPGEFVIRTIVKQTYLTAVEGGGRTTNAIHTDATGIGSWEKFRL